MRIAVLADIHGNLPALEACLRDAEAHGAQAYWFLGDYLGEMPWPAGTLAALRRLAGEAPCVFLRGNKEDYWLTADRSDWRPGNSTTGTLWYNTQALTEADLDFFRSMTPSRLVSVDGLPPVLLCHGSPRSNREVLLPPRADTDALLRDCGAPWVLCAHTHRTVDYTVGSVRAVNPGSVGQPVDDSHQQAHYLLLAGEDGRWSPRFIALDYDREAAIRSIEDSGLLDLAPGWTRVTLAGLRGQDLSHRQALENAMACCVKKNGTCVWPHIPEDCWQEAVIALTGSW